MNGRTPLILSALLQTVLALQVTNSSNLLLGESHRPPGPTPSSRPSGAGSGPASCAAPPYRSREVHWKFGCPPFASCCTEFGFCRPQVGSVILK